MRVRISGMTLHMPLPLWLLPFMRLLVVLFLAMMMLSSCGIGKGAGDPSVGDHASSGTVSNNDSIAPSSSALPSASMMPSSQAITPPSISNTQPQTSIPPASPADHSQIAIPPVLSGSHITTTSPPTDQSTPASQSTPTDQSTPADQSTPTEESSTTDQSTTTVQSPTTSQSAPTDQSTPAVQATPNLQPASNLTLAGFTLCIDAGHQMVGNSDLEPIAPGSATLKVQTSSGTYGRFTGVPEYKLNLSVALLLQAELKALGANVVMTRESNDVDLGNIDRAEIGNNAGADLVVRIHADGSENPDVHGISVLVPGETHVGPDIAALSLSAGNCIYKSLLDATGAKGRRVVTRTDLTGFNWSTVPVVLVELGFMTNEKEDRRLQDASYQKALVAGIVEGIRCHLEQRASGE